MCSIVPARATQTWARSPEVLAPSTSTRSSSTARGVARSSVWAADHDSALRITLMSRSAARQVDEAAGVLPTNVQHNEWHDRSRL